MVDAQAADAGSCRLLLVLQVSASEVALHLADGGQLERLPLPYGLEGEVSATH